MSDFHISKSPSVNSELSLDSLIAVGFGDAYVLKDNSIIYQEPRHEEDFKTVREIEELAKNAPNHNWQIVFDAPLWDGIYQRNKEGKWLCIKSGQGFA